MAGEECWDVWDGDLAGREEMLVDVEAEFVGKGEEGGHLERV